MIEQSVKLILKQFVFEANNAQTWTVIKSRLENFLNNCWKEGMLFGTKTSDAYYVIIGLGSTMTSDDILNGKLNVSIGVAPMRASEFIMITLQQQMSGM